MADASPCASSLNFFGAVFAKTRTRLRETCTDAANLWRCDDVLRCRFSIDLFQENAIETQQLTAMSCNNLGL